MVEVLLPEVAFELHLVGQPQGSGRAKSLRGGFLGLHNIAVFDHSPPLHTGRYLEQADGTARMTLLADNMLGMAIELAMIDDYYADMVLKFPQHDAWIMSSLVQLGGIGTWDEEGVSSTMFCDFLTEEVKGLRFARGLACLFCAATPFEPELFAKYPEITERCERFMNARPELTATLQDLTKIDVGGRRLFAVLDESKNAPRPRGPSG